MDACECIDFERLAVLSPECQVGIGDCLESRHSANSDLPPFAPMRFVRVLVDESREEAFTPIIYDPTGCYRKFPVDHYRDIVRLPPIEHPEVQEWITNLRDRYADWYIHPEYGNFNLRLLDADTQVYDNTHADESYFENLRSMGDKLADPEWVNTNLKPYAIPEQALYLKFIREWYPDFAE